MVRLVVLLCLGLSILACHDRLAVLAIFRNPGPKNSPSSIDRMAPMGNFVCRPIVYPQHFRRRQMMPPPGVPLTFGLVPYCPPGTILSPGPPSHLRPPPEVTPPRLVPMSELSPPPPHPPPPPMHAPPMVYMPPRPVPSPLPPPHHHLLPHHLVPPKEPVIQIPMSIIDEMEDDSSEINHDAFLMPPSDVFDNAHHQLSSSLMELPTDTTTTTTSSTTTTTTTTTTPAPFPEDYPLLGKVDDAQLELELARRKRKLKKQLSLTKDKFDAYQQRKLKKVNRKQNLKKRTSQHRRRNNEMDVEEDYDDDTEGDKAKDMLPSETLTTRAKRRQTNQSTLHPRYLPRSKTLYFEDYGKDSDQHRRSQPSVRRKRKHRKQKQKNIPTETDHYYLIPFKGDNPTEGKEIYEDQEDEEMRLSPPTSTPGPVLPRPRIAETLDQRVLAYLFNRRPLHKHVIDQAYHDRPPPRRQHFHTPRPDYRSR